MKLKRMHWFGIVSAGILILVDLIYFFIKKDTNLFLFLLGIGLGILFLPFVIGVILENRKDQDMAEMFLEFSRNLAESVATGTPVSKSIINMKKKNFGSLSPHVEKLANQISLGIPVGKALETFASDIGNSVISRAVSLIREAERAGGEIDYILESVAKSISEVDKLKKERKAGIYNLVVQGYIVFFIFIGIMLIMQFHILPLASSAGAFGRFATGDISAVSFQCSDSIDNDGDGKIDLEDSECTSAQDSSESDEGFSTEKLARPFLFLLVAQGLLAGITIGKLAEGNIKAGLKHSFILSIAAILISTGANVFLR